MGVWLTRQETLVAKNSKRERERHKGKMSRLRYSISIAYYLAASAPVPVVTTYVIYNERKVIRQTNYRL